MSENFDRAFDYTLLNEGGFSDHKADSGGATNYGITRMTLSFWRKGPVSTIDVQNMHKDEAKAIYRALYWDKIKGDKIVSQEIATAIFDTSVLFGVVISARYAQKVLRIAGFKLKADGMIGPITLKALNSIEPTMFIIGFQAAFMSRINEIITLYPKNQVFRKGWENRVKRFSTLVA